MKRLSVRGDIAASHHHLKHRRGGETISHVWRINDKLYGLTYAAAPWRESDVVIWLARAACRRGGLVA